MNNISTKINAESESIDLANIEKAKEFFNGCRYNEAEQIFTNIKSSEAAAWRILCHIVKGDIGKKGGKISTLLKESMQNQSAAIGDIVVSLNKLINEYGSGIDKKTKNKVSTLLYDIFNHTMKEKMAVTISDINKRALQIVKEKGYAPSIYDDKTIPLMVLNCKMKKPKYRIRHYKPEDIYQALEIINDEKFVQEVVDEYMLMAHSNLVRLESDYLDTRNNDILKYIRSLYISNIAYEKELKFTRSMDKSQFTDFLNMLCEKGWVRVIICNTENTKYFNMANDEEKAMFDSEIKKSSIANILISLLYEDIIERRGYILNDGVINQISKEDIAIGDVTNRFTHDYIGPVSGTIYCDN